MKIKKLSKVEWVGVALVIVSMVLFPYGLLASNNPVAVVGIICMTAGVLTWRVYDMRKSQGKAS